MNRRLTRTPSREKRLYDAILHLAPAAYYPLNELNGTVALNHAPQTRYALSGAITGATIGQPGKAGKAYNFDASNDRVVVSNSSQIQLTGSYSLIALVYLRTFGGGNSARIIDKNSGVEYVFFVSSSGNRLALQNSSAGAVVSDADSLVVGSWQLVAVDYVAGTRADFFVNGTPKGSPALTTNPVGSSGNLIIGDNAAFTRCFDGLIQHVAIVKGRTLGQNTHLTLARLAGLI
jgi:hypothetical protein